MGDMREISLEESREMSLKLEDLLNQEAKIIDRKAALSRENKVEMDRCIDEQNKVREIILTGKIGVDEQIQEELFEGDETTSFNVTMTFSSMRSGIPICEIDLQDMLHFHINPEIKSEVRSAVNAALFEVKQKSLGYTKMAVVFPIAPEPILVDNTEPQFAESLNSEAGEIVDDELRAAQDAINDEYSSEVLDDEILDINGDGTERIPTLDEIFNNEPDDVIQEPFDDAPIFETIPISKHETMIVSSKPKSKAKLS